MSWGHAVSTDMLHWKHLPVALREENEIMIFSGSVVPGSREHLRAVRAAGAGPVLPGRDLHRPRQGQADAEPRRQHRPRPQLEEVPGNPVVDFGLKDFRDPKVFWHAPTRRWVMVSVLPDVHKVRFLGSSDLKRWEILSDFGPAGATGGVWECPDLFPLSVDGSAADTRWVLDVDLNPGGQAGGSGGQYFVGTFDGSDVHERQPRGHDAVGRLRQGLLRDDLVRRHPGGRRAAHLDGLDGELALRERGADRALARRAVRSARPVPAASRRGNPPPCRPRWRS